MYQSRPAESAVNFLTANSVLHTGSGNGLTHIRMGLWPVHRLKTTFDYDRECSGFKRAAMGKIHYVF